ncbi:MAG: hypothetical protein C0502_05080 [Opitutus sp.]|nr:hypothetical protein [Opitutus sp.]
MTPPTVSTFPTSRPGQTPGGAPSEGARVGYSHASGQIEASARQLRALFAMTYAKEIAESCTAAALKLRELSDPVSATYFEGAAAEFRDVERIKRAAAGIDDSRGALEWQRD